MSAGWGPARGDGATAEDLAVAATTVVLPAGGVGMIEDGPNFLLLRAVGHDAPPPDMDASGGGGSGWSDDGSDDGDPSANVGYARADFFVGCGAPGTVINYAPSTLSRSGSGAFLFSATAAGAGGKAGADVSKPSALWPAPPPPPRRFLVAYDRPLGSRLNAAFTEVGVASAGGGAAALFTGSVELRLGNPKVAAGGSSSDGGNCIFPFNASVDLTSSAVASGGDASSVGALALGEVAALQVLAKPWASDRAALANTGCRGGWASVLAGRAPVALADKEWAVDVSDSSAGAAMGLRATAEGFLAVPHAALAAPNISSSGGGGDGIRDVDSGASCTLAALVGRLAEPGRLRLALARNQSRDKDGGDHDGGGTVDAELHEAGLTVRGWSTFDLGGSGGHTVAVAAVDGAGNVDAAGGAAWAWEVDVDSVQTSLDSAPPPWSDSTLAAFRFTCRAPVGTSAAGGGGGGGDRHQTSHHTASVAREKAAQQLAAARLKERCFFRYVSLAGDARGGRFADGLAAANATTGGGGDGGSAAAAAVTRSSQLTLEGLAQGTHTMRVQACLLPEGWSVNDQNLPWGNGFGWGDGDGEGAGDDSDAADDVAEGDAASVAAAYACDPTFVEHTWVVNAAAPDTLFAHAPPTLSLTPALASWARSGGRQQGGKVGKHDGQQQDVGAGSPEGVFKLASSKPLASALDSTSSSSPSASLFAAVQPSAAAFTPFLCRLEAAGIAGSSTGVGGASSGNDSGRQAWAPCGSTVRIPPALAATPGLHLLEARAVDSVGAVDPTPAKHAWLQQPSVVALACPAWPLGGTAGDTGDNASTPRVALAATVLTDAAAAAAAAATLPPLPCANDPAAAPCLVHWELRQTKLSNDVLATGAAAAAASSNSSLDQGQVGSGLLAFAASLALPSDALDLAIEGLSGTARKAANLTLTAWPPAPPDDVLLRWARASGLVPLAASGNNGGDVGSDDSEREAADLATATKAFSEAYGATCRILVEPTAEFVRVRSGPGVPLPDGAGPLVGSSAGRAAAVAAGTAVVFVLDRTHCGGDRCCEFSCAQTSAGAADAEESAEVDGSSGACAGLGAWSPVASADVSLGPLSAAGDYVLRVRPCEAAVAGSGSGRRLVTSVLWRVEAARPIVVIDRRSMPAAALASAAAADAAGALAADGDAQQLFPDEEDKGNGAAVVAVGVADWPLEVVASVPGCRFFVWLDQTELPPPPVSPSAAATTTTTTDAAAAGTGSGSMGDSSGDSSSSSSTAVGVGTALAVEAPPTHLTATSAVYADLCASAAPVANPPALELAAAQRPGTEAGRGAWVEMVPTKRRQRSAVAATSGEEAGAGGGTGGGAAAAAELVSLSVGAAPVAQVERRTVFIAAVDPLGLVSYLPTSDVINTTTAASGTWVLDQRLPRTLLLRVPPPVMWGKVAHFEFSCSLNASHARVPPEPAHFEDGDVDDNRGNNYGGDNDDRDQEKADVIDGETMCACAEDATAEHVGEHADDQDGEKGKEDDCPCTRKNDDKTVRRKP